MATIIQKTERARGCGYRKAGGIYLVADGPSTSCGKLPAPLPVCPCCGAGIKFARGFTWISSALFDRIECSHSADVERCFFCPFSSGLKMGLLWVGENFYKTAGDFTREAEAMGISRRISAVPHDFELGRTWIALAHIKAIRNHSGAAYMTPEQLEANPEFSPGVFRAFRPSRIEYIVTGKETEEELERLERRGLTLVKVTRDVDTQTVLL